MEVLDGMATDMATPGSGDLVGGFGESWRFAVCLDILVCVSDQCVPQACLSFKIVAQESQEHSGKMFWKACFARE